MDKRLYRYRNIYTYTKIGGWFKMRMDFFCGDAQVGILCEKIGLLFGGAPRLGVCRERLDYYLGGRRPGWASVREDWIIIWGGRRPGWASVRQREIQRISWPHSYPIKNKSAE